MKTRNRRYRRYRLGWAGTNLENRPVSIFPTRPRFLRCDGRWSFPTNENSTQICTVGEVGFRRQWILLITNPLNCWASVPVSQINMASLISRQIHYQETQGQTSGKYPIYRQNFGWSAKSKIPDRLKFFRLVKTRLKSLWLPCRP